MTDRWRKVAVFLGLFAAAVPAGQKGGFADMDRKLDKATFAAGCFWGVEKVFSKLDGVVSTSAGYTGGRAKDPDYEAVCTGLTGHAEAVEVVYDPARTSYEELLVTFWQYHDPTTPNRQGPDIGTQYRSAIFFNTPEQEAAARRSKETLERSGVFKRPIVTEITRAGEYYRAEEYHQRYLEKNPNGYCSIQLQSKKIAEILRAAVKRG